MARFHRYQSAVPNRRGNFPGVFALANGLAERGLLTADDRVWLTAANPGHIVYEDAVQVVAVPHAYPADWVLREPVRPDRPVPDRRSAR